MILKTHIPKPPLDKFIECFIFYEGVQFAHAVDRFLPNGDTEILIDFHDTPQYIYDNDSLKEIQACHHVWASGVRTEPITIPSGTNAAMMVILFKKGMAGSFYPFPIEEISDSVIDADLIWGRNFGFLRERLLATKDIDCRFSLAENFFLNELGAELEINPCVEFAVREMQTRPDDMSIRRLNERIGYSQRHFIEMFKNCVGLTPKAYLKIMRFQKAVAEIEAAAELDWAEVANNCGFYDQSHFINEFRHYSGFTPEMYAKQRSDLLNYVPVG